MFQKNPESFDLVIADQDMVTITGAQLSQQLLQIRDDIPIFLMTGDRSGGAEDILKSSGIWELWMKPVEVGKLVLAIQDRLARGKV